MRLGAHADEHGVAFSVYSRAAERVDLCLFDGDDETRVPLRSQEGNLWIGSVEGIGHGQQYGFRARGGTCNAAKLLLDPYARRIDGGVTWHPALFARDDQDSAPYVPRSLVHSEPFDWGDDRPPGTRVGASIFYELHVKGFTKLHPDIPEAIRGTYAGLGHPAAIEHLLKVGVTAVELLPIHQFVHDQQLVARGLRNYWGYQSIGFFAPHNEYASGDPVSEFKAMVKALHAAGLEVILDVVYNHTAEGGANGPALCFRGLDDERYYRHDESGAYIDETGCGNTFDTHRAPGLRLVMDSLRYWRTEMHVDGFRFDLAVSLSRGASTFDRNSAFLEAVGQDPTLDGVKLIAEPWDISSYEVGDFPSGWSEWNGRFRDTVRDFWRGTDGKLADLATRIAGSPDLYERRGHRLTNSVNLITVHDGFTLADLVSYNTKHNEANGENNRDGSDDNRSWNCGVEGPTDDPEVLALRARQQRNLLTMLLASAGVPLLVAGDELGRTQWGNNNAYCQDNELSWLHWPGDEALTDFVATICRLRRGRQPLRKGALVWFRPDGAPMTAADWNSPFSRAVLLVDAPFALLINGWWEPLEFTIPVIGPWSMLVDTAGRTDPRAPLEGRSLRLLTGPPAARAARGKATRSVRYTDAASAAAGSGTGGEKR